MTQNDMIIIFKYLKSYHVCKRKSHPVQIGSRKQNKEQ